MRRYVWVVHDNDRGNEGICKLFRNKKDAVKLFNSIADDFEQDERHFDELEIDRKELYWKHRTLVSVLFGCDDLDRRGLTYETIMPETLPGAPWFRVAMVGAGTVVSDAAGLRRSASANDDELPLRRRTGAGNSPAAVSRRRRRRRHDLSLGQILQS